MTLDRPEELELKPTTEEGTILGIFFSDRIKLSHRLMLAGVGIMTLISGLAFVYALWANS